MTWGPPAPASTWEWPGIRKAEDRVPIRDPSHEEVLERLALGDRFFGRHCYRCTRRKAAFLLRGKMISVCPECVQERIALLDLELGGLPRDLERFRREAEEEVWAQTKREGEALTVDWNYLFRCHRCGRVTRKLEMRYPRPEPGTNRYPPHCYACYLICREEGGREHHLPWPSTHPHGILGSKTRGGNDMLATTACRDLMRSTHSAWVALGLIALAAFSLSCGGSSSGPPPVEEPVPTNVSINPGTRTLDAPGATVQYTATVRDELGREMTGIQVSWSSSNTEVATVSATGLATAVAQGTTTIVATVVGNVSGWATLTVAFQPLEISTSALMSGTQGFPYSQTLTSTGTTGLTWSILVGSLPDGLSLDPATGVISGTPTTAGTSSFTVQVARVNQTTSKELSILIASDDIGIGFGPDQFVLIPAGTFSMGSETGQANEQPVHSVTLSKAFYLQKSEVTQHQWAEIMGGYPGSFPTCGLTCPADGVSWNMIQTFLEALNAAYPGANYRLPTEAEWEYAARAGSTGDFGGSGNALDMGWFLENSGGRTRLVAQKQANAFGLYDMHGNLGEWVQDWYSPTYYSVSPSTDPLGPDDGTTRVIRGGSMDRTYMEARSAFRRGETPNRTWTFSGLCGFRLAWDAPGG